MNRLQKVSKSREIAGLLLLAMLVSFCMKDVVNQWADSLLPMKSLTVSAMENDGDRSVTIVYEGNDNEFFPQLKEASGAAETGWAYVEGEPGVRWTSLTLPPQSGQVTVKVKCSPRYYVTFFENREGGVLKLSNDKETIIHDCYKDVDNTELNRLFPFQHSKVLLLIKTVVYIALFMLLSLLFFTVDWFLKSKGNAGGRIAAYFRKPITAVDFFICWVGLFVLAVYIYKVVGIPNYIHMGDEGSYWEELILNNGKWDVEMLAVRFAPRGYWCYIPQSIAHYIGDALSIDSSIVWMLIPSAVISWLSVYILPGLYALIGRGGKARKLHIIPVVVLMVTIWREYLTCVATDLFGLAFLFAGVCYIMCFFKTGKWTSAVLAGTTASIAVSFRTANLPGLLAVAVYGLIATAMRRRKAGALTLCRIAVGVAVGLFSFVVVCLPQLQVNLYRNHPGLLPYDHDQAYRGRSVTAWSSDYAMTNWNIAYPLEATDDQMHTMKDSAYVKEVPLNMEQLLDTYMESPLETVMLIGKKLIIGFDKKTNIAYPNPGPGVPWRETKGMLFSLWNYFVLFSGLYALFRSRTTRKEKAISILVLVFLVLPETFMKIEWRYVFAGYMMLYYFFSYHFMNDVILSRDRRVAILENSGFLVAFVLFAVAYFTCSFTLLA